MSVALASGDERPLADVSTSDDFAVLSLLPSLLENLYIPQRKTQKVLGFVEEQIVSLGALDVVGWLSAVKKELQKLIADDSFSLSELENLQLDQNKAITLAFVFGDMFTEAVEILAADGVKFDSFGKDTEMAAKNSLSASVIHQKVTRKPESHRRADRRNLVELQTRSLVQELGFRISDTGQLLPAGQTSFVDYTTPLKAAKDAYEHSYSLVNTNEYLVDVSCWFCSCADYQRCYTRDWKSGDRIEPKLKSVAELGPSKLTQTLLKLGGMFQVKQVSPMPFCCHLLAVLMAEARIECEHKYNECLMSGKETKNTETSQ